MQVIQYRVERAICIGIRGSQSATPTKTSISTDQSEEEALLKTKATQLYRYSKLKTLSKETIKVLIETQLKAT